MKIKSVSKKIVTLKNIEVLASLVHDIKRSPMHLPRIATFSGPSGYGKSFAASYAVVNYNCIYLQIDATWTISHLLDEILKELGVDTIEKTVAKKMAVVVENLMIADRVLILDEFDHFVTPKSLEIIRGMQDKTGTPIILIGEELLPKKLEKTERFHNRVFKWVKAEAVTLDDAKLLAKFYVPKIFIGDDLMSKVVKLSQGRVRRVCINLEHIKNEAILNNWKGEINLDVWGKKALISGDAPAPRRI